MTIPTYLLYFIAAGTVAVLITILYGLNRALADAHWPVADRTRTLRVSAVILLGWLGAAITLSAMASTMSLRATGRRSNTASCCRL